MMVCLCHPFSDKKVRAHLSAGVGKNSVSEVYSTCSGGQKPQCCSCLQTLKDIIKDHKQSTAAA